MNKCDETNLSTMDDPTIKETQVRTEYNRALEEMEKYKQKVQYLHLEIQLVSNKITGIKEDKHKILQHQQELINEQEEILQQRAKERMELLFMQQQWKNLLCFKKKNSKPYEEMNEKLNDKLVNLISKRRDFEKEVDKINEEIKLNETLFTSLQKSFIRNQKI